MSVSCFRRLALALVAMVSLAGVKAEAQSYPTKPINLIVPFTPGGSGDIVGRLMAGELARRLGQPVVVENQGGAGGIIGTEAVSQAAPDGYTLLLGTFATHAINRAVYANLPYDPVKDFAPIAVFGVTPYVLAVNAKSPAKTVKELVQYAQEHPGSTTYASAGNGSGGHLAGVLFGVKEDLKVTHIPYRGGAQALTDLVAGRIDFIFYPYSSLLPQVRAGTLRALGVTTADRIPALPDVPTMNEAGVKDFEVSGWFAVFAPAGTPDAVVTRLNTELRQIMDTPSFKEQIVAQGMEAVSGTPDELAATMRDDIERWKLAADSANVRLD